MTRPGYFSDGEERLRFALGFAQADLRKFRPGDWLNLRDDLGRFLLPARYGGEDRALREIVTLPPVEPPVAELTELELEEIQAATRAFLSRTLAPKTPLSVKSLVVSFVDLDGLKLALVPLGHGDGASTLVMARGTPKAVFLYVLSMLLGGSAPLSVKKCEREDCGLLFIPIRSHQRYCDRRCVNVVNQRQLRERQARERAGRARRRDAKPRTKGGRSRGK